MTSEQLAAQLREQIRTRVDFSPGIDPEKYRQDAERMSDAELIDSYATSGMSGKRQMADERLALIIAASTGVDSFFAMLDIHEELRALKEETARLRRRRSGVR